MLPLTLALFLLLFPSSIVRKEGRALGEVTKYLVYNARKRGGDSAEKYFQRTENVAGVKDMRFQALMPDVLHWLGVTKIDRFMSMSNMVCTFLAFDVVMDHYTETLTCLPSFSTQKHDAVVEAGIPVCTPFRLLSKYAEGKCNRNVP